MARIDSFLRLVVEQKASDLHFMAGNKPLIRHDGVLVPIPFRELTDTEARRFLMEILTEEQRDTLLREQEVDFAYTLRGSGRFRANVFQQSRGIGAVFRVIPEVVPELDALNLPSSIRQILDLPNGLVLFCGPTGCGKSTTQAALINELNTHRPLHIITIEDPIEFLHRRKTAVLTQRQVGEHVATFETALRSALRESPDVVLVGEMRDLETMKLALSAAETGVLVFGTLHTGSAAKAVDRIVDAFPEGQADQVRAVLSVIVRAIVSQRLVRNATGEGRVAAIELLFVTTGVANMIRENKAYQIDSMLQSVDPASGMQSLDTHLLKLVRDGQIHAGEALQFAMYPERFHALLDDAELLQDTADL
jgi:twitching motility protein PilT